MNGLKGNNMKKDKQEVTQKASPLLERYLQKTMTDRMQDVDSELIAKAIKTLLSEDNEKNTRLN